MANEENNFENDEINQLLGSLKRVDAPGDFDFRVRGRIAAGHTRRASGWQTVFARVAVPAVLVLLVAGYFGVRSLRTPAVNQVSVVPVPVAEQPASEQALAPQVNQTAPSVSESSGNTIATKSVPIEGPKQDSTISEPIPRKSPKVNKNGGSMDMDMALSIARPRGPRIMTKQSLSAMGVEADPSSAEWNVGSVKQNSVAERSGLKAGDVIVGGKITGGKIRVRREGKVVTIPLKP